MSSRSMGFVSHAKRTKAIEKSMIWDHQIPSNYVNYSIGFNMFDEIAHTYSIVFGWPFRLACLQFATYYIVGVRNRVADKNRKRTLENTLPWSFSIRCKTLKLNKHYLELCKWKILFTSQTENTIAGTLFSSLHLPNGYFNLCDRIFRSWKLCCYDRQNWDSRKHFMLGFTYTNR